MGGLIASMPSASAAQTGLDLPWKSVQFELSNIAQCHSWVVVENKYLCQPNNLHVQIKFLRNPSDDTVQSVEISALAADIPRNRREEEHTRALVIKIVHFLLPNWTDEPKWIEFTMKDSVNYYARHVTQFDGINILVRRIQLADLDEAYAEIELTKNDEFDE